MPFTRLQLSNFRNIRSAELAPSPLVNVIWGPNASGKTSFLEALYVLSHGRSFRSSSLQKAVGWGAEGFSVFGELVRKDEQGGAGTGALPLGVGRRSGRREIRIGGQSGGSAADLARAVPLVLIHPGSHELVDGGPKHRRDFLNWGVFHVEHSFHGVWINYQRALRQRNACLRGTPRDSLRPWDREVAHWGEQVAKYQKAYVNSLQRSAAEYTEILLGAKGSTITLSYRGGWDMNAEDLLVALSARVEQDRHVGHTTCGPHRADVLLEYRGILAAQALSRGQQKLAVIALRLAQAQHLRDLTGRRSLFAIDDVPSELDQSHRRRLIELLCKLQAQIFLTATEPDLLDGFSTATTEMFHVEHGEIEPGC